MNLIIQLQTIPPQTLQIMPVFPDEYHHIPQFEIFSHILSRLIACVMNFFICLAIIIISCLMSSGRKKFYLMCFTLGEIVQPLCLHLGQRASSR